MENSRFEEINLKDLLNILAQRWWIVGICLGLCIILVSAVTIFMMVPVYQADTSLYVGKVIDTQGTAIAYNDLILGDRLVSDYRELVKSRQITGMVIEELGLDISPSQLAAKLNVSSKKDTRIIEITAQDTNPQRAMLIADAIAETFRERVIEIMHVENVQIIDKAVLPKTPVKPNKRMNLAVAMVLGLMTGLALVFLIEYFDRTVKTPDDIKNQLGIPVIGVIPDFEKL